MNIIDDRIYHRHLTYSTLIENSAVNKNNLI